MTLPPALKTLFTIKLAFAGLLLYAGLAACGQPIPGLILAAPVSLATAAAGWRRGQVRPMELGLAATLALFALLAGGGVTLWGQPAATAVVPALLLVQGVIGALSCLRGRPWTAAYAAASHAAVSATPQFHRINQQLSALWAVLFLALAASALFRAPPVIHWLLLVAGLGLSLVGPRLMLRLTLARTTRDRDHGHWPTPPLPVAGEDADLCDIAVVGAGLGGLTAAALLATAGLRVIVADRQAVPGGFAQSWRRKVRHGDAVVTFRFDAGVHDVSGLWDGGPVQGLLQRLGITLDWLPLTRSELIAGTALAVPGDWRDYADRLAGRFPASADGIRRFFATARTLYDDLYALGRDRAGVPIPPTGAAALLAFARAHPLATRWLGRPFAELAAAHIDDPAARGALTALAGYVTDRPDRLTVTDLIPLYGYYFHGGYYPRGGSGMLGHALADTVRRAGGTVLLNSPVAGIVIDQGRAAGLRLASGRVIRAGAVIANADLKRTMLELVPATAVPARFRQRLTAAEPAPSAFMVHLGLVGAPEIPSTVQTRLDDGSLMTLVAPSLLDPSAAPAGYGTLELIVLLPHAAARSWWPPPGTDLDAWRRGADYAAAKRALGDRMIAAAAALIPRLRERIICRHDASPLTFARYAGTSDGAIYGLALKDRFHGVKSPVPGLYLAGAGTVGPGVEAAMIAGARVAEAIRPGLLTRPAAPAPAMTSAARAARHPA